MRLNIVINQQQCLEFGLSVPQAALMGLLSEIGSWASEKVINGNIYYHVVRSKIIKELPLFYGKSDAIYMDFKTLLDKGLIEYIKDENRDYVRFSEIGKMWNEYIPVK